MTVTITVVHANVAGTEFEKEYTTGDGPLSPGPEKIREAVSLVPDHHRVESVEIER